MPVPPPSSITGFTAASRASARPTTSRESARRLVRRMVRRLVRRPARPVAGHEFAPAAGLVAEAGHAAPELVQGTQQPREIAPLPGTGPTDAAAVEVEQPHGTVLAELDVVRVQVGVTDARLVKAPDGGADAPPFAGLDVTLAEHAGQRAHPGEATGEDIAAVECAAAPIAGSRRSGHGQPQTGQPGEQAEFPQWPGGRLTQPEELVVQHPSHQSAASVMAQREVAGLAGDETHGATPGRIRHVGLPRPGIRPQPDRLELVEDTAIV